MKRLVLLLAIAFGAIAQADEPHLGFELEDSDDGHPKVVRVYKATDAEKQGIAVGDIVYSVSGLPAKDKDTIAKRLSKKAPGANLQVRVKTKDGFSTKTLILASSDAVAQRKAEEDKIAENKARIEQAKVERERLAEDRAKRTAAAMEKILAKHGAVVVANGSIQMNVIGRPEIALALVNASPMEIDAVEFRVELFDKFDRPANGLFGDGNSKVFVHQTPIPPKSLRDVIAPIPFNDTAGKARVSVVRYLPKNGEPVDVVAPYEIEVSR